MNDDLSPDDVIFWMMIGLVGGMIIGLPFIGH